MLSLVAVSLILLLWRAAYYWIVWNGQIFPPRLERLCLTLTIVDSDTGIPVPNSVAIVSNAIEQQICESGNAIGSRTVLLWVSRQQFTTLLGRRHGIAATDVRIEVHAPEYDKCITVEHFEWSTPKRTAERSATVRLRKARVP